MLNEAGSINLGLMPQQEQHITLHVPNTAKFIYVLKMVVMIGMIHLLLTKPIKIKSKMISYKII